MNQFRSVPRRTDAIEAFKRQGGLIAAVLPIHYSRALFRAFHILPVEVWGPPGVNTSYAAAHLQLYLCSVVRNALSFLLSGGLDVADFLAVPHACDSLQGLGSILIDLVPCRQPVIPIYLPRGRRQSDIDFLAQEFRSIYQRLETITERAPTEAELLASIQREEMADQLLAQLHRRRRTIPLTDSQFYRLVRSREYLPAEAEGSGLGFTELAQEALTTSTLTDRDNKDGVPILLSGIVPEPLDMLETISELGGSVVADDLACCGRRLYPTGTSQEPFRRMAERLVHAPPDQTRGSSIEARLAHLTNLVETSGARGVVFYNIKFCEPELFDLPALSRELERAGIPSLALEVDISDPLLHQVRTRLEAFLEMIR